ncbi:MAG TPA: N-acetylmuramoyl-L-alanine amidase [Kofleriaceae bacterium]|nr:N-acetylmuramoyl-L-alanine amidase [Kofleriaceae bacterium]
MSGLVVHGTIIPVDGVHIITSADAAWCRVPTSKPRPTPWVRQYILHKTIADFPEDILAGAGPIDGDRQSIEGWAGGVDGAHLVTGYDGRTCCLADLALTDIFHATASNPWSVGHEMKEKVRSGVYQATLDATVKVCLAACRALGIQLQMPRLGSYTGHPIARMSDRGATPGGPDMVGIFGHRDNTERRGHWDPGDAIFKLLAAHGVEQFDFAAGQDREVWRKRQIEIGIPADEADGIPGPGTVARLKAAGYVDGIWALGKAG